ncbi:MAG TPA: ribonuclease R [bacterium]|nr:ribonuclease R [bacterium]
MSIDLLKKGISNIVKEFKLATSFPREVEAEARAFPGPLTAQDWEGRVDLRAEVVVTIDGENARDFDDAVSVSETRDGFVLKVSIADVSHFVKPGTAVDREAYRRATSTYFPDRVLPMLPERLSNDLCSLVPHEERRTYTAEMAFDVQGRRTAIRFYRSVIKSRARLTYTEVRKILDDRDEAARGRHKSILEDLERMGVLAERIQGRRRARGSLDFDLPESSIELDLAQGRIDKIVKAERNKAHRLIEEFMIAANEAVAEFIAESRLPSVYRVHQEPDPERVRDFAVLLHHLGYGLRLGRRVQPGALAAVIEAVRGKPEEKLINTVLLRTMARAVYDTKNVGHFGLASECYTHFTSPIRRYPDLMVHRILTQALRGGRPGKHKESGGKRLQEMAVHCSERERNSQKAEWASRDLAAALFLKEKVGQTFDGIISGVTKFGLFVELIPFFVEGLVSIKNLRDDAYTFHEKAHALVGRRKKKKYQIGMPVTVTVQGVNLEKRWVDFGL